MPSEFLEEMATDLVHFGRFSTPLSRSPLRPDYDIHRSEGLQSGDPGTDSQRGEDQHVDGMPQDNLADDLKAVLEGGANERTHARGEIAGEHRGQTQAYRQHERRGPG